MTGLKHHATPAPTSGQGVQTGAALAVLLLGCLMMLLSTDLVVTTPNSAAPLAGASSGAAASGEEASVSLDSRSDGARTVAPASTRVLAPFEFVQYNEVLDPNCTYRVDFTTNSTSPPLSEAFLERCGGPVTGWPARLPMPPRGDPGLECNDWNRHVYSFTYSTYKGYTDVHPHLAAIFTPFHRIFSDFGCFTANRAPTRSLFMHSTGSTQAGFGFVGLVKRNLELLDMSSPYLMMNAKTGQLKSATTKLVNLNVGIMKKHATMQLAMPPGHPKRIMVSVEGDALLIPVRYTEFYIGLQFAEMMAHLGRAFTSGLFDKANLTIVMQKPVDPREWLMRRWIEPWLAPHRVLWLEPFVVADVERGWYVPVMSVDPMNACSPYFTSYWLLPRMLRAVRGDANFTWGDARLRGDPSVSDEAWAKTLPRMLVVMKQAKNSRSTSKSFVVTPETRAMLQQMGYVWVTDDAPFHHRIVLLSHAEQILTTYGSMMTINAYMWGGLNVTATTKRSPRYIILMHPLYDERQWATPRHARYGVQDGIEVFVSNLFAFQSPGAWSKLIIAKTGILNRTTFTKRHAQFTAAQCTFSLPNHSKAEEGMDFLSREVPCDYKTAPARQYARMHRTWASLPKFGLRCPMYPQYGSY